MFMVLLTAFKVLLARHLQEQDLVVGVPHAGRSMPEFENLVGAFMGAVGIRSSFARPATFLELLRHVRQVFPRLPRPARNPCAPGWSSTDACTALWGPKAMTLIHGQSVPDPAWSCWPVAHLGGLPCRPAWTLLSMRTPRCTWSWWRSWA